MSAPATLGPKQQAFKSWLCDEMELCQYYDLFVENGFDDVAVIRLLGDEDLKELGIDKKGSRMKLILYSKQDPQTTKPIQEIEFHELESIAETLEIDRELLDNLEDITFNRTNSNTTIANNATQNVTLTAAEIIDIEMDVILEEMAEVGLIEAKIKDNMTNITNATAKQLELDSIAQTLMVDAELLVDLEEIMGTTNGTSNSTFGRNAAFNRTINSTANASEYSNVSMIDASEVRQTFDYRENAYLTAIILLNILIAWALCSFCYCLYVRLCGKVDFMTLPVDEEDNTEDIELYHTVLDIDDDVNKEQILHDPSKQNVKEKEMRPSLAERFNLQIIPVTEHDGEEYDQLRKDQIEDDEMNGSLEFADLGFQSETTNPSMQMPFTQFPSTKSVISN